MEMYEARVIQVSENHLLELDCKTEKICITLTEDRPIDVKEAFNKLLILLKQKEFKFEVKNPGTDLFSIVSVEYVLQLNKDLASIRSELVANGLVNK